MRNTHTTTRLQALRGITTLRIAVARRRQRAPLDAESLALFLSGWMFLNLLVLTSIQA